MNVEIATELNKYVQNRTQSPYSLLNTEKITEEKLGITRDGKDVAILTKIDVESEIRNEVKQVSTNQNSRQFQNEIVPEIDLAHRQVTKIDYGTRYNQCKVFHEALRNQELSNKEKVYHHLLLCTGNKPFRIAFIIIVISVWLTTIITLTSLDILEKASGPLISIGLVVWVILWYAIFYYSLQCVRKNLFREDISLEEIFAKHRTAIYSVFSSRQNYREANPDDDGKVSIYSVSHNTPMQGIDTHTYLSSSINLSQTINNWFDKSRKKINDHGLNGADLSRVHVMIDKYEKVYLELMVRNNACWEKNEAALAEYYLKPLCTSSDEKCRQLVDEWVSEFVRDCNCAASGWNPYGSPKFFS